MTPYNTTHLWHPCTAVKDLASFPPISIQSARGSYFYTHDGQAIIDAISSWWCKNLGHQHPRLQHALITQAKQFEHVMVPNTRQDVLEQLSCALAAIRPELSRVAFASDGSCAVEMAVKLALHAKKILGQTARSRFMCLNQSYHGETGLALSLTAMPLYQKTYKPILIDCPVLHSIPYVNSVDDPLWQDCSSIWPKIEQQLLTHAPTLAAIIVEPIVQAAAGMRIYSKDFLVRLRKFTEQHDIYLISDEIFTGFGRTGTMLACDHAAITPDFICLGKGLTGGVIPMSAMLTRSEIYNLFDVDFDPERIFFHSHTFGGHALAAAVANAVFTTFQDEKIYEKIKEDAPVWQTLMHEVQDATGQLCNIRALGGVIAADLVTKQARISFEIFKASIARGAFLRPLGHALYWAPPLNTSLKTMQELRDITIAAVLAVLGKGKSQVKDNQCT